MTIPARAHFVWIGPDLPWAYVFSVLSAAKRSNLREIVLHHTEPLRYSAEVRALKNDPRVRLSLVDAIALLNEAGSTMGIGRELVGAYQKIASSVIRSDILRIAILYLHGGIYLDLDTITVNSLLPLLNSKFFVGHELIVWPLFVKKSRSPRLLLRSLALDVIRKALRRFSLGHKLFKKIDHLYYRNIASGVLGAEANSAFLAEYLQSMVKIPPEKQSQLGALGPDLLNQLIERDLNNNLIIHGSQIFYPLPSEISEHWFRIRKNVNFGEVISPDTRVVHWYASVRTWKRVCQIDPDYVRGNRYRQLFSALVCEILETLPAPHETETVHSCNMF